LDINAANYSKAIDHVLGKRVNYEYLYSDALVYMGGPHPEEQNGQVLMMDCVSSPVKRDRHFSSTIMYSTKSPFFRHGPSPSSLSNASPRP
jgi:hypothetical protein